MAVKTYDPKAVQVSIGGNQITGFADGEFISVERAEDSFTKVVGADGEVSRAKSNNKSGMLTLTLQGTALANDILSGIAIADELDNSGVVPVFIKDTAGTTVLFAAEGWIRRPANYTAAKEITNREWVLDLATIETFIGGNS
jgi:hypothetical protein